MNLASILQERSDKLQNMISLRKRKVLKILLLNQSDHQIKLDDIEFDEILLSNFNSAQSVKDRVYYSFKYLTLEEDGTDNYKLGLFLISKLALDMTDNITISTYFDDYLTTNEVLHLVKMFKLPRYTNDVKITIASIFIYFSFSDLLIEKYVYESRVFEPLKDALNSNVSTIRSKILILMGNLLSNSKFYELISENYYDVIETAYNHYEQQSEQMNEAYFVLNSAYFGPMASSSLLVQFADGHFDKLSKQTISLEELDTVIGMINKIEAKDILNVVKKRTGDIFLFIKSQLKLAEMPVMKLAAAVSAASSDFLLQCIDKEIILLTIDHLCSIASLNKPGDEINNYICYSLVFLTNVSNSTAEFADLIGNKLSIETVTTISDNYPSIKVKFEIVYFLYSVSEKKGWSKALYKNLTILDVLQDVLSLRNDSFIVLKALKMVLNLLEGSKNNRGFSSLIKSHLLEKNLDDKIREMDNFRDEEVRSVANVILEEFFNEEEIDGMNE